MRGMPPIVWDHAEDVSVFDNFGNQWLDWSSGVLVTNSGHSSPEICDAIRAQVGAKKNDAGLARLKATLTGRGR
jgi:4-aminobutyrate aminotransferase-like enzyme